MAEPAAEEPRRGPGRTRRRQDEPTAMGLLFAPVGVGIIVEWQAIRAEWLPITAGLFGSTLAGLASAGWLMHRGLG